MRRTGKWAILAVVLVACGGPSGDGGDAAGAAQAAGPDSVLPIPDGHQTLVLTVPTMSCPLCSRSIEGRLAEEGLSDVRIDLRTKNVSVVFDPARITPEEVAALVEGQGFPVTESRILDR